MHLSEKQIFIIVDRIISKWPIGYTNKEVLNNLEDSKIYRTDINGTILFQFKKRKADVLTFPP